MRLGALTRAGRRCWVLRNTGHAADGGDHGGQARSRAAALAHGPAGARASDRCSWAGRAAGSSGGGVCGSHGARGCVGGHGLPVVFDDEDRDRHAGDAARGPRPARPGPARPAAGPGAGGNEAPGVGGTRHATASAVAQRRVRQPGPGPLDPPARPARPRARRAAERPARQAPQAPGSNPERGPATPT